MFYSALRTLLFKLEPERAHALSLAALQMGHRMRLLPGPRSDTSEAVSLLGVQFPNRVGLAGGFDKNGTHTDALGALGFGFIEVGTVTPLPQPGQLRPRLFRIPSALAVINRMGFPNDGAAVVAARLAARKYAGVCGANIGKNAATPIEAAANDYVTAFRVLGPHVDYVAVNVSSPNTKALRQLQQVEQLRPVLLALLSEQQALSARCGRRVPLLVKVAPDLDDAELRALAGLVREHAIDGVIATNSTVRRPAAAQSAGEEGGLSGAPLLPLALAAIRALRSELGAATAIIGVGGIANGADARAMLDAGANLVQLYTALIYRGPSVVREIRRALCVPGSVGDEIPR